MPASEFTGSPANLINAQEAATEVKWVYDNRSSILLETDKGISNDDVVEIDGTPNSGEFARFTANGIEGRTVSEILTQLDIDVGGANELSYLTDYTVTEGDVTAHEAALTILASQLSGVVDVSNLPVGTTSSDVAAGDHTHPAADITSGTLAHERGGLEADVSAYSGLIKISGGATAQAVADTDYQSVLSEGAFADGDKTKLDGIEASADVTDTANVTAAGALMDSEVTNLADVKTFDPADYATAAQGSLADSAQQPPSEGAFVNGDKTKLDGIESGADVTDTANVTAAGALMDSEVTNLAQVKAFDSSDYATAAQGSTADSALQDVVDDTTPTLGGELDGDGNAIFQTTAKKGSDITHNASGDVTLSYDTESKVKVTVSSNVTGWDLSDWPTTGYQAMLVEVVDGGSATVTWEDEHNASITANDGTTPTLTASGTDLLLFLRTDNATPTVILLAENVS